MNSKKSSLADFLDFHRFLENHILDPVLQKQSKVTAVAGEDIDKIKCTNYLFSWQRIPGRTLRGNGMFSGKEV